MKQVADYEVGQRHGMRHERKEREMSARPRDPVGCGDSQEPTRQCERTQEMAQ